MRYSRSILFIPKAARYSTVLIRRSSCSSEIIRVTRTHTAPAGQLAPDLVEVGQGEHSLRPRQVLGQAILGIERGTPLSEIKRVYRKQALPTPPWVL
jgi:hypothetical protein